MPTMTIRNFAAIAATTTLALVGSPAWAAKVTAPLDVNIVGADSICSGWTTGLDTATGALTLTCIPSTPPAPGTTPGACTINGSSGPSLTGTVGTPVTLTASCPDATGYVWTSINGSCASSAAQACAASATAAGTATYTVKGTNGALVGPGTNASVQWSAGTTPPPTNGAISCSSKGYKNTVVVDVPWKSTNSSTRIITSRFDGSTALVMRFTVPANYSSGSLSRISGVEYGGGPINRYSTLSSEPCDFGDLTALPAQNVLKGTGISAFWLQVGGTSTRFAVVEPGKTYYLNVRNSDEDGNSSCTTQTYCNMAFGVTVPN